MRYSTDMFKTSRECGDKGGSSKGSCAAGFGVCCVFMYNDDDKTGEKQIRIFLLVTSFIIFYFQMWTTMTRTCKIRIIRVHTRKRTQFLTPSTKLTKVRPYLLFKYPYVVYDISDICWFRLDFETFTTVGPSTTLETGGGECVDKLTFTVNIAYHRLSETCSLPENL